MHTIIKNADILSCASVYLHVDFQIFLVPYVFVHPLWQAQMPLAYNRLRECCSVYKQGDLY